MGNHKAGQEVIMRCQLGTTGIEVTAIGLGAMPLSLAGRPDEEQAFQVIKTFLDHGGNFIDTANVYCLDDSDLGHNERLIAKVLKRLGKSAEVIVATKGGLKRPRGDWIVDGRPEFLRQSVEQSLKALDTDCITLYQLHAVDPKVGLEASLDALIDLQGEGKIRYLGLSNVNQSQLERALEKAAVVSVQNRCNVLEQWDFQSGLVAFCQKHQITYIPHSPVGGHHGHKRLKAHPLLNQLASRYRTSPYALALAWLLAKGEYILPIPGASKPSSIEDSLKAMEIRLAPEDIAALDALA
ncbi:MAG: aldo/keto reductase [Methylohalobius sp.]|nr:aldo/keto reductase [Methylohalobius sp.]